MKVLWTGTGRLTALLIQKLHFPSSRGNTDTKVIPHPQTHREEGDLTREISWVGSPTVSELFHKGSIYSWTPIPQSFVHHTSKTI